MKKVLLLFGLVAILSCNTQDKRVVDTQNEPSSMVTWAKYYDPMFNIIYSSLETDEIQIMDNVLREIGKDEVKN